MSERPLYSFGLVADIQYCDCDTLGTRYFRFSLHKLREAISTFKGKSVSFIINLGDTIDRDIESFEPIIKIFNDSGIKTYHITGNHDYCVNSDDKNKIPFTKSLKKKYYAFEHREISFIFLDGNEISTYATNSKISEKRASDYISHLRINGEINAVNWNGGIGKEQIRWLVNKLDKTISDNKKVVIFCHFPIFPKNMHNLLNSNEVIAILSRYNNIIAWFSGHNHAGNYGNFNGIHCITVKGMVETDSNNSFSIIKVFKDKIYLQGFGRETDRIIEI